MKARRVYMRPNRSIPGMSFMVEVTPGRYRLTPEADEIVAASLDGALRVCAFAAVPDGAKERELRRLALLTIARLCSVDPDMVSAAMQIDDWRWFDRAMQDLRAGRQIEGAERWMALA